MAAQLSADHAPIVAAAAAAMITYRDWFNGDQQTPEPPAPDTILSPYCGGDIRLYNRLANDVIDAAKAQGLDSRDAGVWKKRRDRVQAPRNPDAAERAERQRQSRTPAWRRGRGRPAPSEADMAAARQIARAALEADPLTRAADVQPVIAERVGITYSHNRFLLMIWTPVRRELGITATGATVARRAKQSITAAKAARTEG